MSATAPADFWDEFHAERPGGTDPKVPHPRDERPASSVRRRRRPLRALLRFVLTIAIGVGGTLAWQSYGDMAREMAANAYPQQLGWLMPAAAPTGPVATTAAASTAAATVGSAGPVATPDQQQIAAMSLSLAGVRHSIEQLAAQLASSRQQIAEVASSRQQMADDIARLQASEQDILAKLAAPSRAVHPTVHRPAPLALSPAAPAAATH
ncbi:MAG TPA: hypothetical protein VKX28_20190 [Xanthobacteraceae bacterium]|nr:hypothetical protein [Xanthobacteraceae bacterium]